jgi:hypothetical protein
MIGPCDGIQVIFILHYIIQYFYVYGDVGKYFIYKKDVVDIGKNSHIYKVHLNLNHFKAFIHI